MNIKRREDYEGIYKIKKIPDIRKPHNKISWDKIEAYLKKNGKASFDKLSILVDDHEHGTKSARYGYQFVIYCIKCGWLEYTSK